MTRFRYWLADLISGGELTRVCDALSSLTSAVSRERKTRRYSEIERERVYAQAGWDQSAVFAKRCDVYMAALRQIAAEVTPGANATVRRMGRIAEEALK